MTKKKILIGICILVILFVLLYTSVIHMPMTDSYYKNPAIEQPFFTMKIKKLLKKAYNEDFEVKSIAYLWTQKSYTIVCYPKDNPDLEFEVWKNGMNGENFTSRYDGVKLCEQARKYYEPEINKIFPWEHQTKITVWLKKNIGSYKKKDFQAIFNEEKCGMSLILYVKKDVIENEREKLKKSIFELTKLLEKYGIKENAAITLKFYTDEDFNKKEKLYLHEEYEIVIDFKNPRDWWKDDPAKWTYIKTPDDIEKYTKDYREKNRRMYSK